MFNSEIHPPSKSEKTRQALIETSLKFFERKGFQNCTMRELAQAADVSPSHFYYYFRSKEEIVAAFYLEALSIHLREADRRIQPGAHWTLNLRAIILSRFQELAPYRRTLNALKGASIDRGHPLSLFHPDHAGIRKASVDLFQELIRGSKLKALPGLQRELAYFLWLYHLGILFYWTGDSSAGQKNSHELLDRTLTHLKGAMLLTMVPGAQKSLKLVIYTLRRAGILEDL